MNKTKLPKERINAIKKSFNEIAASKFIKESNRIESIDREPTKGEIEEHLRFIKLDEIIIDDLLQFISVYQPNAELRTASTMNLVVGNYMPPAGGMNIHYSLGSLLEDINESDVTFYQGHCAYEALHPFTDCNGRTGRAIWAWMMYKDEMVVYDEFLRPFYYQGLGYFRENI